MKKLSPTKSVNILTHMESINNLSVVKTVIEISIIKAQKIGRYYSSAFVIASVIVLAS
jgi:hypothetical protein